MECSQTRSLSPCQIAGAKNRQEFITGISDKRQRAEPSLVPVPFHQRLLVDLRPTLQTPRRYFHNVIRHARILNSFGYAHQRLLVNLPAALQTLRRHFQNVIRHARISGSTVRNSKRNNVREHSTNFHS